MSQSQVWATRNVHRAPTLGEPTTVRLYDPQQPVPPGPGCCCRIRVVTCGAEVPGKAEISASPRMLTFVDVPPGTMFVLESVEFDGGRVVTFFSALAGVLQPDGSSRPDAYPADDTTDEGMRQREAYWKWFVNRCNSQEVVKAVEEVIRDGGGRPWRVDYKMIFATGEELNLHVAAHGDYDTSVLAYDLIRRSWRHGVRIIGSLKSQPALDVLAIYEKLRQL